MTFLTYSLGCKVNSYECSAVSSALKKAGFIEVDDEPDIFIINTCSVTATADQKSRQHIRKLMAKWPNAISVVMGCYAQGNSNFIFDEIQPTILLGTSNRNKIVDLIKEYLKSSKRINAVDGNPRKFCYEELGLTSFSENVRAYLKIGDGCNNFCSYCIVPFRRGQLRSRPFENIIQEAKNIVSNGYKEIVLTGIDVSSYGKDLENVRFTDLIKELVKIDGLERIRISSIEASEMDDELFDLFKHNEKLVSQIHIPLQSGSEKVLQRMHRKYDKRLFLNNINKLKEARPDIAITGDVIVGFPGETEEEFNETNDFIKECGYSMLHVFPYSPRTGTVAAKLKDQVDGNIKNQRVSKLINLSNELWNNYCFSFINKELDVLYEKYDAIEQVNIGHTGNYIEVKIPSKNNKTGQIEKIILTKSMIISSKNA